MAEKAHSGQTRASGEPYIEHPKKVAEMLQVTLQADEETVVAALLHDIIEDTDITAADLEHEFGAAVSNMVEGVTKVGKVEKTVSSQERNLQSIRKMIRVMGSDIRVIFIKLADRLHNMETLDHLRPEKQRRIARETQDIYCPLANLLGIRTWYRQLSDLCFMQLDKDNYDLIQRKRIQAKRKEKKLLEKWVEGLQTFLKESTYENVEVRLVERHAAGIASSVQQAYAMLDQVETFYSVKIVVPNEQDCYSALGYIHQYASVVQKQIKDYIAVPKVNGYRALHTRVLSGLGSPIFIAVQTQEMLEQSMYGEALLYLHDKANHQKLPHWAVSLITLENEDHDLKEFYRALQSEIFGERVHVHVLNSKSKFVDIPVSASALDLAYYTDAKLGSRVTGVNINGEDASLTYLVRDGDVVDFSTQRRRARKPQDMVISHTSLGQKLLTETLSAESERVQRKLGTEYISAMVDILMDPFYPTSWRIDVWRKIEKLNHEFASVGRGDLNPFDLINWVCDASNFFLVDSKCFSLTSQVAPDPQIRFVSSVSVDRLRTGKIIGLQTRPDVIEILPIDAEDERKTNSQELVSLGIANPSLLEHPFHFALKWIFDPSSNPLDIIAALQTHISFPVELLSFNDNSATMAFHVSSLQTLRVAYEYLYAQDTIKSIVRISP